MGRKVPPGEKKRVLWISDAVSHTGFSRISSDLLAILYMKYDVHVLGINYKGDPHEYPYKIYPAGIKGDMYGVGRLPELLNSIQPDIVFMINDPWIVSSYLDVLVDYKTRAAEWNTSHDEKVSIPVYIAYMPVDGLNLRKEYGTDLNRLDHIIAYNEFGKTQFQLAGVTKPITAIPHCINTELFYPIPREEARAKYGIPKDWYIVGLANRSQPRKRIDLAIKYFAEWVHDKPDTVKFYYHGAIKDVGIDIPQLMAYYGIDDRLMLTSLSMTSFKGIPAEDLKYVYSVFNVHISTTAGEGFGYTQAETMACGIPNIVPEWSALAEWPRGGVLYVPCTSTIVHPGGINTIGGLADETMFIGALEKVYTDSMYRAELGRLGYDKVHETQFHQDVVASQFDAIFKNVLL